MENNDPLFTPDAPTEALINFVPKQHSPTGASGLHRWRADHCPGSVRLIAEKAPAELDVEDEVRDDGIEAHGYAEQLLNAADRGRAAVVKAYMANRDIVMFNGVVRYVEYVRLLAELPGAELLVEHSFDLSWLADGLYGTADAVVYAPQSGFWDLETEQFFEGPTLHVIDLKYGFKRVDAEENDQALYYALGAYYRAFQEGKKINRIVVHIYQPRVIGMKTTWLTWSCDVAYLENFALRLKDDKLATDDPDAPLRADVSWCRLCRARTICPELAKPAYVAARMELKVQGRDPNELPSLEEVMKDRALQYKMAKLAAVWAESITTRTRTEMTRGEKYEGLKLVAPRGYRQLVNIPVLMERFPVAAYPTLYHTPDLKSAAQIVEELSKNPFVDAKGFETEFVQRVPGEKPLIAPVDDPRPVYDPVTSAQNEWADEIQEAKAQAAVPVFLAVPPVTHSILPPPPAVDYGNLSFLTKP